MKKYAVRYSYVTEGWVKLEAKNKKEIRGLRVAPWDSDNYGDQEWIVSNSIKEVKEIK